MLTVLYRWPVELSPQPILKEMLEEDGGLQGKLSQ